MKAHSGVDADTGLVHTVVATPANVHDLVVAGDLLHGREVVVHADSGYRGVARWCGLAPIYRTVMGWGADGADGWDASKATGLR